MSLMILIQSEPPSGNLNTVTFSILKHKTAITQITQKVFTTRGVFFSLENPGKIKIKNILNRLSGGAEGFAS